MQKKGQISTDGARTAIPGLSGLAAADIRERLSRGDRPVRFEICLSFLFVTIRRHSRIHLTASWQERYIRGMGHNALTLLLGPWGVPWGLLWTVRALWTNLTGGIDASQELLERLEAKASTSAVPF